MLPNFNIDEFLIFVEQNWNTQESWYEARVLAILFPYTNSFYSLTLVQADFCYLSIDLLGSDLVGAHLPVLSLPYLWLLPNMCPRYQDSLRDL